MERGKVELINQAIKKLFYRKYKFINIDRRGWIFRIYWLGWSHINLGISLYLRAPNIEIHLPFCFIRAGIDNVNTYNENRERTGRCVMKIVVTVVDCGAAANVGGGVERRSAIIDLSGIDLPQIVKNYLSMREKMKGLKNSYTYQEIEFSVLDEEDA